MNLFLTLFYFLLLVFLAFWINKKKVKELPTFTLPVLLIIKLGYAYFFYYVYTYIYGDGQLVEDAYAFFHDSRVIHDVYFTSKKTFFEIFFGLNENIDFLNKHIGSTTKWINPSLEFFNDTRNIIRANVILHFISKHVLAIHFMVLTFLSFLGSVELFQWLKNHVKLNHLLTIALLTLVPSIAFWSSSLLKESILLLTFGVVIRAFFDASLSKKQKAIKLSIGIPLAFAFKPYIVIALLLALLYYYFVSYLFAKQWANIVVFLCSGIFAVYLSGIHQPITRIISNKQYDFNNVVNGGLYVHGTEQYYYYIPVPDLEQVYIDRDNQTARIKAPITAYYLEKNERYERFPMELTDTTVAYKIHLNLSGGNSKIKLNFIHYSYWRMIQNIPAALFNTMVEPIPKKGNSPMLYYAFLENMIFLGLLLYSIYRGIIERRNNRLVNTILLFVLISSSIIGLTTPVAGAIFRYMIITKLGIIIAFLLVLPIQQKKEANKLNCEGTRPLKSIP